VMEESSTSRENGDWYALMTGQSAFAAMEFGKVWSGSVSRQRSLCTELKSGRLNGRRNSTSLRCGMETDQDSKDVSLQIAQRWCDSQGQGWSVHASLGKGGTAPVFEVVSPDGPRALKIYDAEFSSGAKGEIEHKRIEQQLALKGHGCPYLVQIDDGGRFDGRLFLLMGRAPGTELATRLGDIPRCKIRQIVDQVTRAAIFLRDKELCHRDIKAANVFISDDFERCTLLDISVIRNVTDPIGLGTDHEGELPVVATARYSPPEYLFRLLEPGPDLWHALNVYQLGALLHDLIMREPLFQAEYLKSTVNRYRFAWIVATVDPNVQADDVDRDLLLTARRALDKNWQRRSVLTLEGFLGDAAIHKVKALQVLGVAIDRGSLQETDDLTVRLQRVREVAGDLQHAFTEHLRKNGVTSYHDVRPGPHDTSNLIAFQWNAPTDLNTPQRIELQVELQLLAQGNVHRFGVCVKLDIQLNNQGKSVSMVLPELQDEAGVVQRLLGNIVDAFEQLAMIILRGEAKGEG
jgi:serine/threonine protein kinase